MMLMVSLVFVLELISSAIPVSDSSSLSACVSLG